MFEAKSESIESESEKPKNENLAEKRIDPELLAEQKISEMKSGLVEIEKDRAMQMEGANDSTKLGEENLVEIKEATGVEEKLSSIAIRAKEFFETTQSAMKKAVAIGMATLVFSGAGEFIETAQAAQEVNDTETIPSVKNFEQQNEYKEIFNKIRLLAINEEIESPILIIHDKKGVRMAENEDENANASFAFMNFEKVDECLEDPDSEIELVHTHTAKMGGYSFFEKEDIKNGKIEQAILMPPSFTDITSLAREVEYFKGSMNRIKNKVVDPFGVWEFSAEENSSFIQFIKEARERLSPDKLLEEAGLTSEQKKLLEEVSDSQDDFMNKQHPAMRFNMSIHMLQNDSRESVKKIGEMITSAVNKIDVEMQAKYPDFAKDLIEIIAIENETREYKSDESQQKIKREIELFRKNGIRVTYEPFEKNNMDKIDTK